MRLTEEQGRSCETEVVLRPNEANFPRQKTDKQSPQAPPASWVQRKPMLTNGLAGQACLQMDCNEKATLLPRWPVFFGFRVACYGQGTGAGPPFHR